MRNGSGKTDPSRVDDALTRVDAALQRARNRGQEFNDPEEITSRHEVEEIARAAAEDAMRARPAMPTPVQVVIAQKPGSDPPVSGSLDIGRRGLRTGKLPPWATVTIALATIGAIAWAFVKTH